MKQTRLPISLQSLMCTFLLSLWAAHLPAAEPLPRESDLTVQLERVRVSLLLERYGEAIRALQPLLDADPTFEAHYYLGIACARTGDLTCAIRQFTAVLNSPASMQFPDAMLELGAALALQGNISEARQWLQQARLHPRMAERAQLWLERLSSEQLTSRSGKSKFEQAGLHAQTTLGLNWDNNPAGLSWDQPSCSPDMLTEAGFDAESSCTARWRLAGRLEWQPPHLPLRIRYQLHQLAALDGTTSPTLRWFDQQSHRLSLDAHLRPSLSLGLSGEWQRVSSPLTAYAGAGQIALQHETQPSLTDRRWRQLMLRCELYRDLPVIWGLVDDTVADAFGGAHGLMSCLPGYFLMDTSTTASTTETDVPTDPCLAGAGEAERYCSARLSGSSVGLELGRAKAPYTWRINGVLQQSAAQTGPRLEASIGRIQPLLSGFELVGWLQAQAQWAILAGSSSSSLVFGTQYVSLAPSLELNFHKRELASVQSALRYSGMVAALLQNDSSATSTNERLYVRHIISVEVTYGTR